MKDNEKSVALPRYVNLTSDAGFKAVFADRSNRHLLTRMLNLLLPEDGTVVEIEEYLDRERTPDFLVGKGVRLDLVCRGTDGRKFIVEMQKRREERFFERCVYYGSGLYRESVERGDEYEELRPVYVVGILDYNLRHEDESLWDTDNVVSEYQMTEKRTGELAPPTISCIFAELRRFTKDASECRSDRDWLFYIFRNGGVLEGVLDELRGRGFAGELVKACEVAGFGREKKLKYEQDMITERDRIAQDRLARKEALAEGEAKGRAEGLAKGLAKGEAKKSREIAFNLLAAGLPVSQIAGCTGLSEEEVLGLRRN